MKSKLALLNVVVITLMALAGNATPSSATHQIVPICYVGCTSNVEAKIAWRVDRLKYPDASTQKSFLAEHASKEPEGTLARFLDLYLERRDAAKAAAGDYFERAPQPGLDELFTALEVIPATWKELRFLTRYDVGQLSSIVVAGPEPGTEAHFLMKRAETGWKIVGFTDPLNHPAGLLAVIDSQNRPDSKCKGKLAGSYKYAVPLHGFSGEATGTNHVTFMLFNGKEYNVPLGKDTASSDPLVSFVNRAYLIALERNQTEWAKLFVDQASSTAADTVVQTIGEQELFPAGNARLVFAIDCGPQAIAFVSGETDDGDMQVILLWRGLGKEYKLTCGYDVVSQNPFEMTFPTNLGHLFESKEFQTFLKQLLNGGKPVQERTHQ